MSGEGQTADPEIEQDPGIPGTRAPDELPPEEESDPEPVPESDMPDFDDEGHMAPERPSSEGEQR
jgi:hypothetical protein